MLPESPCLDERGLRSIEEEVREHPLKTKGRSQKRQVQTMGAGSGTEGVRLPRVHPARRW